MSQVFTEFVRGLDPSGELREPASFARLWTALRGAVRAELKRRGLWDASPAFLGVVGWPCWHTPTTGNGTTPEGDPVFRRDALDELAADCYMYIFVLRLRSLRAQLKLKPNIDGLVFRNIRNFLHDTQRRQDPLGFRVYGFVRASVEKAQQDGRLEIDHGDARAFSTASVLSVCGNGTGALASLADLEPLVHRWNDELFPKLLTQRGPDEEDLLDRLTDHLTTLPRAGVERLRFQDLVTAFKHDLRAKWFALWQASQGETAVEEDEQFLRVVQLIQPEDSLEAHDDFSKLHCAVAKAIGLLDTRRKTREYLLRLWRFLGLFALSGDGSHGEATPGLSPAALDRETLPSHRELSRLLKIPRERLPELFHVLRREIRRHRESAPLSPARPRAQVRDNVSGATP